MNAIRSPYRNTDARQLLQETLKHLLEAREFYRHAARSVVDREIRDAFAFSSEAHAALLQSLYTAAPAVQQEQAVHALALPQPHISAFTDVAATFDGRRPQASANELHALDDSLLQRIEALFANYPDMRVRAALKQHVLSIRRAGDATRRLALRNVA